MQSKIRGQLAHSSTMRASKCYVLAKDGQKPRIEPPHALFSRKPREAGHEPSRIPALRHQPDPCRLQRREQNIRKEPIHPSHVHVQQRNRTNKCRDVLSRTRSAQIDCRAVLHRGLLVARDLRELFLPKLVSREFASSLDKIADGGRSEAREECGGAFGCYDMSRASEEVQSFEGRVDLDTGFDNVDC